VRCTAALALGVDGLPAIVGLITPHEEPTIVKRCIHAAALHPVPAALDAMTRAYLGGDDRELKLALLDGMREAGSTAASRFLVSRIDQESHELTLAAIAASGTCGDLGAVEPLHRFAESPVDGRLKTEARKSIAMIQARFGRGEAGMLTMGAASSIAAASSGALSAQDEVQDAHGGLSAEEVEGDSLHMGG
jgi:hypothetical protein